MNDFLFSFPYFPRSHSSKAWKHMSRADTTVHLRALLFFFHAYPSTLAGGSLCECFFFLRFILIPSSFSHLRSFFLCLLGNLAVVICDVRSREILGVEKSAQRGGGGRTRIQSRNVTWMQYLKAAQRQYSLSSLSAFLAVYAPPSKILRGRETPVTVIRH